MVEKNNNELFMAYCPELETNIVGSMFSNRGKIYIIPEVDKDSLVVSNDNGKTWKKVKEY